MNIFRVILATLLIFGSGALSGYFVAQKQINEPPTSVRGDDRGANGREGSSMDRGRRSFMDRLQRDLELTDDQRDNIADIFAKSRDRTKELWKQMRDPMQEEIKRVHEEVKTVLTPEQAAKFDEINKRREQFRNKSRESENGASLPTPGPNEHCFIPARLSQEYVL